MKHLDKLNLMIYISGSYVSMDWDRIMLYI